MMASGEEVIGQIQSESLLNLLTSIASETAPLGSTQIPSLDAHCFSSIPHHASPHSALNRGDIIEIQGPPASGKTHLVYFLLTTCILPSFYLSTRIGGWGKIAVVFDTDGAFNVSRFKQIVGHRLSLLLSGMKYAIPTIVDISLERLCIFSPTSTIQLAASIADLPRRMAELFPQNELGLAVVDSTSAFYWRDRFAAERKGPGSSINQSPAISNPSWVVIAALQDLRHSLGPVIVLTNWGLIPVSKALPTVYHQHLSAFPDALNFPERGTSTSLTLTRPALSLTHHITTSISSNEISKELETMPGRIRTLVGIVRTPISTVDGRFILEIMHDGIQVS